MTVQPFETVEIRRAHADAETVAEFLSRTGYQLPIAVADLIDNAIDARASRVQVSLLIHEGRPSMLVVADNGRGMTSSELERAVSLEKDPSKQDGRSLGRYGAGLKAASFSIGRVLNIVTRAPGSRALGAVLDQTQYRQDYEYQVMAESSARTIMDMTWGGERLGASGTVLLIKDLSGMVPNSDTSQDLFLGSFARDLDTRLGLIFHRYLQSGRLRIGKSKRVIGAGNTKEFEQYPVTAVDPFGYRQSGHPSYPKELLVNTGQFQVPVHLHLWPKQGRTKATRDPFYDILGRSGEWQGLYFYRWDRLLQAGGWNGLRSQEPHMSYARISVDLPPGSDDEFRPTVMKDRIENARPLLEVLMKTKHWASYMASAGAIYRGGATAEHNRTPAPAHAQLERPFFAQFATRPCVRIDGKRVAVDSQLISTLGHRRADAVAELCWQALRPFAGRQRLAPALREDLDRIESAVAELAGRPA